MIEFIHILPPWLAAFSAVLIVLLLGALVGLVASGLEERRRAAEAARWNTRMAGLRAAEQIAQQALGAAIGPKIANDLLAAGVRASVYEWPRGTPLKADIGYLLMGEQQ